MHLQHLVQNLKLESRLEEVKKVASTLSSKGFQLIPVKGVGFGKNEAKKPVEKYLKGYKYDSFDSKLNFITLSLLNQGKITAFGVAGKPSGVAWLDLDKLCELVKPNELLEVVDTNDVYIQKTASGRLAIAVKVHDEDDIQILNQISNLISGLGDVKWRGYEITAPSFLISTEEKTIYTYDKLSKVELWETTRLKKWKGLNKLIKLLEALKQEETTVTPVGGNGSEYNWFTPPDEIFDKINILPLNVVLDLGEAIAEIINCPCLVSIIKYLRTGGELPSDNIKNVNSLGAGFHHVFEMELLGFFYTLGVGFEKLCEIAELIRYKDYEPETPPSKYVRDVQKWRTVTPSGLTIRINIDGIIFEIPFCPIRTMCILLSKRFGINCEVNLACDSTPVRKLDKYLRSRFDEYKYIVDALWMKLRE